MDKKWAVRERKESRMTSRFLSWATRRVRLSLTEEGQIVGGAVWE